MSQHLSTISHLTLKGCLSGVYSEQTMASRGSSRAVRTSATGTWLALLLVCTNGSAEQPPCDTEVPLNVVLPDATLVRGLKGENFVARTKHESVRIESLTTDSGRRRILFVVETGKHVPDTARAVGATVLSHVLSIARTQDSFALLTARGPRREIRFGSGREALNAAVEEFKSAPRGKNQEGGVLDALLEASEWFREVKPGDAIFVMTMGIESAHRAGYSKVRSALADRRIRLFGFQLGQMIAGSYQTEFSLGLWGQYSLQSSVSPNQENVFALGFESGGFVCYENTAGGPQRQYKLTDERLEIVKVLGRQMYKAATNYYSLRAELPRRDYVIELADPMKQNLPQAVVTYPRYLPDCASGTDSGEIH